VSEAKAWLEDDAHDRKMVAAAHPPGWTNPTPPERYDLVVLGGGTAGLVSAAGAALVGARVALVERALMGGDCLVTGCVPSKALVRAARAVADVRRARELGVEIAGEPRVNFPELMERIRRVRAEMSPNDGAERFQKLGVDVYLGEGAFSGPDSLDVGQQRLRFHRAIVATGARATLPPVPGLDAAFALTNETVWNLRALPPRLAVVGAGPLGCELAQAFARLGSRVTLLEVLPRVLGREDEAAGKLVHAALVRDGVAVELSVTIAAARVDGADKVLALEQGGQKRELRVDAVLVGAGRAPNVAGLGLEKAGVSFDATGVKVDDFLETSSARIYAAGDVCSSFKFTHVADALARTALRNTLFPGGARASALVVPWCTYTDPEVAQVGLTADQARARGLDVRVVEHDLRDVDRAILDGETDGFAKVVADARSDRILGATLVSRHAGESISEITLAMTNGLGLAAVAKTIHPYPTQAEAWKRVADRWSLGRLTPRIKGLVRGWLALSRRFS